MALPPASCAPPSTVCPGYLTPAPGENTGEGAKGHRSYKWSQVPTSILGARPSLEGRATSNQNPQLSVSSQLIFLSIETSQDSATLSLEP